MIRFRNSDSPTFMHYSKNFFHPRPIFYDYEREHRPDMPFGLGEPRPAENQEVVHSVQILFPKHEGKGKNRQECRTISISTTDKSKPTTTLCSENTSITNKQTNNANMMKSILLVLVLAIVQKQSVVQADISFTRSASTGTGGRRMLRSRSAASALAAEVTPAEPAAPTERLLSEEEEEEEIYEPDVYLGPGCEQTDVDGDEEGENDCETLVPVKCQTEEEESDPEGFGCLPKCTEGQEQFDENKIALCYVEILKSI